MKRKFLRILLAAGLSLLCFLGTWLWYRSTGGHRQTAGLDKPVAFVEKTKDEIRRRPATRMIWQSIQTGEPVYNGEAISTSSLGEVRIQFAESSRFIDVEPDSQIVISQNQSQEISLDLMNGGMTAHQGSEDESGPGISLKSGDSKIDLSKATASISKSSAGQVDLQVIKGQVKVNSNGKQTELGTGKSGTMSESGVSMNSQDITILSPKLDQPIPYNVDAPEPLVFSWNGFPKNSLVTLFVGTSRSKMQNRLETNSQQGKLSLAPGTYYWKLVGKDPTSGKAVGETSVFRTEILTRYPPVALSPVPNERIQSTGSTGSTKVPFRWERPEAAESVWLEVSKQAGFANTVFAETIETNHRVHELPDGDYFYRVNAKYLGSQKPFYGKAQSFSISKETKVPITPIAWAEGPEASTHFYVDKPVARLKWAPVPNAKITKYRVKLAQVEENLSTTAKVIESKVPEIEAPLEKDGHYVALVEGLNEQGHVVSVSKVQPFDVTPYPLLPAARLLPQDGDLQADPQGRLDLKWEAIPGAKAYEVTVLDAQGKPLRNGRFEKNSTSIINLLPGELTVQVTAIDVHGRFGEKQVARKARVPASSGLSTPKLKKLKVH